MEQAPGYIQDIMHFLLILASGVINTHEEDLLKKGKTAFYA